MLPEKHIKDLESSAKRAKIWEQLSIALLFLGSFLLFGPLIHEGAHLLLLELKNCIYLFNLNFVLPNGVYATVEPLCVIRPGYLVLFYSSGYLATILLGGLLNIMASLKPYMSHSKKLTSIGTGMLLSVVLTIGVEGDIQSALNVMNLNPSHAGWISLLIVLGVFAASIHGTEVLLDLERQE